MKRTVILCPECMKKKLIDTGNDKDLYCDGCGTEFKKVGTNTVRYK